VKKYYIIIFSIVLSGNVFSQNWLQQRIISDQFQKAVQYYDAGQYAKADVVLQKFMSKPLGDYQYPITLLEMKTSFALGDLELTMELGKKLIYQNTFLSEAFMALGDVSIEKGNIDIAFRMYLRSRFLEKEDLARIDSRLNNTIRLSISPDAIEEQQLSAFGNVEIILNLADAYNFIKDGNPDECAFILSKINPTTVPESFYDLYEQLQLASYQPGIKIITFGVVLPLSGKDTFSGSSFLRGLHQYLKGYDHSVQLAFQVEDSQSDPVETIKAVKRLAQNRQIYGIITSLDEIESLAVVNAMSEKLIPVFVLGGTGIAFSDISENIFQLQADWKRQGVYSARWIANQLEKDSVAILAPTDEFGDAITDAFLREMDALNHKVIAVERYSGKPESLKKQFQTLRQKAFNLIPPENPYDEYLGMSFDSLDALFEVSADDFFELNEDDAKEIIQDSSDIVLETIQALYLPIHPDHMNYIGTQLPMYNLKTTLVGNFAWNQSTLLGMENIGPHLKQMTILSQSKISLLDQSISKISSDVNKEYWIGFDLGGMLFSIMNSGISNKTDFLTKLEKEYYEGAALTFLFTPEDHSNQSMQILRYDNNKFIPIGEFVGDSIQYHVQQKL